MFCDFHGYPFKLLGDTIRRFVSLSFFIGMSDGDASGGSVKTFQARSEISCC